MLKPVAMAYDRIMSGAEEGCLVAWRQGLMGALSGDVLEIGAGTGGSLDALPSTLRSLTLLEPDKNMRLLLERALSSRGREATVVDAGAESLPFPDATFDAVISSLVLCSVKRQEPVLAEIHRVLKPGGRFVFLEHVAARDRPRRLKWQHRVEPVWKLLVGNCHLTRDTETTIQSAGFTLMQIDRDSMRGAPPFVRPTIRGYAVPA